MQNPDYALIVGGPASDPLADALRAALPVRTCPGAADTYCPVLRGDRCPLRDEAKVTIVHLAGEHEFFTPGQWECVTASTAPAVAVLQGVSHPARGRDGFALVGAEKGTIEVLAAVATLVDDAPHVAGGRTDDDDADD